LSVQTPVRVVKCLSMTARDPSARSELWEATSSHLHDAPAVEPLSQVDEPEAAAVLARAFRDNPGVVAVLDTDDTARRSALLERFMPIAVSAYRRYGEVRVTRDAGKIAGVALGLPPGQYPPSLRLQRALTTQVVLRLPLWTAIRLGAAELLLHRQHLRGPHHYLFMLGVDPRSQGRGHGGALLRALAERADREQQAAYLETDTAANVSLYQRHGFEVIHSVTLPRQRKLVLWFMRRAPVVAALAFACLG
jgi:ribosomal protein S18 acetylase RimI-like enzyme